ncbi:CD209 antigen-like protein 2 [Hyalella azteca]|uniref:CD209 antigen-like protein 2 n=1 Tax=Hyalella azteca TaxID=294128 RepID=A0A8B7NPE0_HYAAZ|nr:CD209 antigen-like protein 2 [Hyalella azteca]
MDMHSTAGLCQHPFVLVGTQCVHIIPAKYTWHDARNQCGLVGGDLFVVDDCDQYHKVALYLDEQDYLYYWIGGSDEAVEGQWRWVDGSPMDMGLPYWENTFVLEQEPDNPGQQNCLELNCAWMYRFSSAWCSDARRVICEADPI